MQKIVTDLLRQWNLNPYVWNFLLIAAALLVGVAVSFFLRLFIRQKTGTEMKFSLVQSLLRHLSSPVAFLIPLFFFDALIPLLQMPSAVRQYIARASEIVMIIGFAWLLIRCIKVAQDIVHDKININVSDNLRQRQIMTQLIYIRRVASSIIILLAIGAVLLSFDTLRKIGTGLLTGVGIGGIIIGFAAQRSLANLLAGFQIAFTQPIRIDDEVIVEGEFGKIEELTLTYVVVRIWDNRRMILPINYFLEKPFQNWTRTTAEIIGSVYFYADYTLPMEWVRNEFNQIIKDHPLWDGQTAGVVITSLNKDVMEIRGIVSSRSSGNNFDLRCHIREQLLQRIVDVYPQCLPRTRALLQEEVTQKEDLQNAG
ncbi:mechanosensitive ion channel family protein [Flavisolibacter nicotianae]|uniref:mechanosensitive ion channel family protein n=1 Tax=Flavisolibacter nicotianae TaxID=2364882 RepID=UPI000EACF224|nr:mechanosensitive ion channel domain-containing protein [Flavisolibacter nicotianae]